MQDLTLVGLTEDRTRLVLVSDTGEEYSLPADAKLRAALRGDHARLGQLEIQMDSALRPRDIQARIRAGESPEDVAVAAQTTVDRIMGFATPVLAERAHIADRAQRASVRRRSGEGPARALSDAVAERLQTRSVDPASVEWDAWRREDGRWTLVADYRSGESFRHAEFVYDAPGRYVLAEDDEARWLVGEQTTSHGPQPRAGGGRRLTAVGSEDGPAVDELPLGEDAIGLVRGTGVPGAAADAGDVEDVTADSEPTEDLSTGVTAVRDRLTFETGDADWMATQATERPRRATSPAPESTPESAPESTPAPPPDTAQTPDPAAERAARDASVEPDPDVEAGADAAADEPGRRPARKNRGRASVPSWDEIMFGGGGGKRD